MGVWDEFGVDFDLCDTEAEAADMAAFYESGSADHVYDVLGVQFNDGRLIPTKQWEALADALTVLREKEGERRRNPSPPIPYRDGRDPFTNHPVKIEEAAPSWIGAQP